MTGLGQAAGPTVCEWMLVLAADVEEGRLDWYGTEGEPRAEVANWFRQWRDVLADLLSASPPTTSEIIAAIEAGDRVEYWDASKSDWLPSAWPTLTGWERALSDHGDQPQPGYRIVRADR